MAYNFDSGQVKDSVRTGAGADEVYVPTLWYFDALSFLGSVSEPCRTGRDTIETDFNKETTPVKLGNFEVPRWSPTRARPLEMRPDPKPICDMNGHFLPGAPRGTSRCFGHYKGTWEMPRRITRQVAAELAKEPPEGRFPDWLNLRVQRPHAAATPEARLRRLAKNKKEDEAKEAAEPFYDLETKQEQDIVKSDFDDRNFPEKEIDHEVKVDPLGIDEDKQPVDKYGNGPYVPGSLTDPEKRHESYDALVEGAVENLHGPQENKVDKFWRKVAENAKKNEDSEDMKIKKSKTPKLPQVNVSRNFDFAKKMHVTNLEHQPLPDTLGYRNLSKIGEHRDSDIIVKPYAIGWKGYGASGPTCCTKMRVHRPKTCDAQKNDTETGDHKNRPSTSALDLGSQSKKYMSLMDLAICWDFKPRDPKWEPRPSKHIDGSNGSKAPAVFTMVHTPKENADAAVHSHANPIFNENRSGDDDGRHAVPYFEKDMTKERRKDSCEVQHCPQHTSADERTVNSAKSSRRSSSISVQKPPCDGIHGCGTPSVSSTKSKSNNSLRPAKLESIKDAWSNNVQNHNCHKQNRNSLESYEKTPLAQGKLHQSSPASHRSRRSTKDSESTNNNDNHKYKHCISCNGAKIPQEAKQRDDYKFAFKAGNPNSVQSVGSSSGSKEVKIPKMRHPYSKKSYTIPTLAPPFSIWREANSSGYPEHWRLASVYQHAYKPPEQRRKPLIESVYQ